MVGFLRKLLPTPPSNHDDDGNRQNTEYSFAMEYSGPLVGYALPLAVPVDIDRVPVATAVASASLVDNSSVPVIQPIVFARPFSKKLVDSEMSAFREPVGSTARGSSAGLGSLGGDESAPGLLEGNPGSCRFGFSKIRKDSSELLGGSDMLQLPDDCKDGTRRSGRFGLLKIDHDSCELLGNSDMLQLPTDYKDGGDLEEYISPVSVDSSRSSVSSEVLSSEDSYREEPLHVKETSSVTFRDPESYENFQKESDHIEAIMNVHERRAPERNVKKGVCYRCLKGNRFTEKEVCFVCSAKYCGGCVLRAMGSMPEGRKCVTCIGFPIHESRRRTLGKCSQMLKRLLSDMEIELIMQSELMCEVNKLPHNLVCVNGKFLSQEEMDLLLGCLKPPKKLKPGKYWYDKVSGLWGKEGHRPCQVISPQLNVGGQIKRNASNGNTNILVNSREITQVEYWMMHIAGIRCVGNLSLWLSADGTYQEEGQKNLIDPIGKKAQIRLLCAVFSLPILPDSANLSGGEVNNPDEIALKHLDQNTFRKILLLGPNGSGTSTIFKQAKFLYNVPFSEDERQNIKLMIQTNLYCYLGILLEMRERFEEEILTEMRETQSADGPGPSGSPSTVCDKTIYSIGQRLKAFSDWLLQGMVLGNVEMIFPAVTREYAPLVEELWKDAAIQATYNRISELKMLPRVANYFLNKAVEVSKIDYEPSDVDILYAEGITSSNGLACTEFSAEDVNLNPIDQPSTLRSSRFELIRAHPKNIGGNCKWLEMFEDVGIILFCVSLADYDQFCDDLSGSSRNKMLESKKFFERVATHPNFEHKDILLILNQFDLLEERIDQSPLTKCEWFHDFNPVLSHNYNSRNSVNNTHSLAQSAFHYIALQFKELFYNLTGRKLYVSAVTGLERDTVGEALTYARTILKWNEEKKPNYVLCDSSYSLDTTTS